MAYKKTVIGDAILYLGDCLEVMADLGQVNHVITDPPYNEATHTGARNSFQENSQIIPFAPASVEKIAPAMLTISKGWVIAFCAMEMFGAYKEHAGDQWVRSGFWRRTNGTPQFTGDRPGQPGEGIAIMFSGKKKSWNGHGRSAFWQFPISDDRYYEHPTPKPEPLMQALVADFTQPGDIVLDPFMGSGTTGAACYNLGRKFIGVEIKPEYFKMACLRIKRAQSQMKLL